MAICMMMPDARVIAVGPNVQVAVQYTLHTLTCDVPVTSHSRNELARVLSTSIIVLYDKRLEKNVKTDQGQASGLNLPCVIAYTWSTWYLVLVPYGMAGFTSKNPGARRRICNMHIWQISRSTLLA